MAQKIALSEVHTELCDAWNARTKHCEDVVCYLKLFGIMVTIIKIPSEQLHLHVENAGPHLKCILTKVARRLVRGGNLDLTNL